MFHGKRTNPNVTPCHVCREDTDYVDGQWVHPHSGDVYCGTGDGSTAYPEFLWRDHENARRAREQATPPDDAACLHCGWALDDGEGYDGYCGVCADRIEAHNEGGHPEDDMGCPNCNGARVVWC